MRRYHQETDLIKRRREEVRRTNGYGDRLEDGRFRDRRPTYFRCDCPYCTSGKLRKTRQSDADFKEQLKDVQKNSQTGAGP